MAIRFLCPNGHGLSSCEQKAGAYGKCPTCDVMFQVPFAETAAQGLRRADAIISFACPSGHAVRLPVRMAGQVSKCPTCEHPIRVPVPQTLPGTQPQPLPTSSAEAQLLPTNNDELVDEGIVLEQDAAEIDDGAVEDGAISTAVEEAVSDSDSPDQMKGNVGHYPHTPAATNPPPLDPSDSAAGLGAQPVPNVSNLAAPGVVGEGVVGEGVDSPHPMTLLFEALWDGTQRDAIVDVYYGENERISPQHYAHELSHGQHAVFAVMEQNETHTLYLIPWSRVHRVAVREITELPPGMFD